MQLKGLVKFFTAALILISLFQLSFTFVLRGVEKKLQAKAKQQATAMYPDAQGEALENAIEARYQRLTDSVQGEKIVNMGFKKYTYMDAKKQELNLGLDLQGGMNVTLDVDLSEFIRNMSNNPKDAALNAAIAEADRLKGTRQEDFVTLFGNAFRSRNPNTKLAYLFTKPSNKDITLQTSDDQVLAKLRAEGEEAINSTYNVLLKRIDKFGVSQPSVNLDKQRGIITVELAGARNPERVRENLQSTAKLQFFETYTNAEIYPFLEAANAALVQQMGGKAPAAADTAAQPAKDTTTTAAAPVQDTAKSSDVVSLDGTAAGADTAKASVAGTDSVAQQRAKMEAEYPLLSKMAIPQELTQGRPGPVICYVAKADSAKLFEYLNSDVVKAKFPNDVKFLIGAEGKETRYNANAPLVVYAIKTALGTNGGAKLEGEHVTDARMDYDPLTGRPNVIMAMDATGSRIWKKMTGDNIGKSVAVVLDDKVYSAPNVESEISGGNTSISGSFTPEEGTDLANILKIGKLEAPAHIVAESVVGPTLGAENILAGKNSLLISFIVIFALMLVYYNTAGIVANIALILNLLFTIGILTSLGFTLTMPGIAGLVLTIGMAVDTNVIIFERIKEELSLGKGYQQAIDDGYKRSYAPVLDGHITQLLTAIILFVAGLGPVKGFATTQIVGLLLSLYCGILVSRLITDMWMKRGRHFKYFTGLSKSIFKKAHFKFIEFRKYSYIISGIVFILGIASYFNGYDKGVEFAGGRSFTVHFDQKHSDNEVREKLKKHLGDGTIVKTIGKNNDLNITTTYLIEKPGQEVTLQVEKKLHEGLMAEGLVPAGTSFEAFGSKNLKSAQTVLPTISKQLQRDALIATFVALFAIFLYILIRFRKWQYSLGTIIALLHDVCITLAVFSFLRGKVPFVLELDQHFIAAILTVIGFSMNDTVIVFDRVREYFRKNPGMDKKSVINAAINDTLSRTIMTSLTVFLTVLILFIVGGEVTRGFAFAMLIGVVTGTYSSIFVAAPVLIDMDKRDSLKNEVDHEARIEELKKLA